MTPPAADSARALRALCTLAILSAVTPQVAAQQFDELTGRGLPREFDNAAVLVLHDVNGDGELDLVFGVEALFPGVPLRLHLGGADGVFVPAPVGSLPTRRCLPSAIVCRDFDADGDVDIFVANRDLAQNAFFVNDGTGRFSDQTAARLPVSADDSRVAGVADVDADGDLDLLVANVLGPDVLLLNDGAGHFRRGNPLPDLLTDDPTAVAFLDTDRDGDPDVVIGNARGPDRLWRNVGGGGFVDATAASLPSGLDVTTSVAVADVDRDGAPDLLLGSFGTPDRVYRNDGTGTFVIQPAWMPVAAGPTIAVAAFDADGDGDSDCYVARYGAADVLLRNDGTGSFRAAAAPWQAIVDHTLAVAAGDVDGDGDIDVVTGGARSLFAPGRKQLLLNDGTGTFVSATSVAWPAPSSDSLAVATGDLDADGDLDVVVAAGAVLELWFGDGYGGLGGRREVATGTSPDIVQALGVGDVDGDGVPEILVGTTSSNVLLRNDGAGGLTADLSAFPRGGNDTRAVLFVDVDGDGDLDVVEANAGSSPRFAQQNRLLTNDGAGRFTDETATRMPARADFSFGVAAGDVDLDGDLDLVIANWSIAAPTTPRQPNRMLLNDGTGRFADAPAGSLAIDDDPTAALALGDLDGDGDPDLVTANVRAQNRLYRNDGTGRFSEDPTALPSRRDATVTIALADHDDDGDLDVLFGNDGARNTLLRNEGPAGLVDVGPDAFSGFVDATTDIEVVDIDRDGDGDVLVANRTDQKDLLLFGLTRQLDLPLPLRVGRSLPIDVHARRAPAGSRAHLWVAVRDAPPLRVAPFGLLRLDPLGLLDLGEAAIPVSVGRTTFPLRMPPLPALVGRPLYFQALVYAPSALWAARLTNLARAVVGS